MLMLFYGYMNNHYRGEIWNHRGDNVHSHLRSGHLQSRWQGFSSSNSHLIEGRFETIKVTRMFIFLSLTLQFVYYWLHRLKHSHLFIIDYIFCKILMVFGGISVDGVWYIIFITSFLFICLLLITSLLSLSSLWITSLDLIIVGLLLITSHFFICLLLITSFNKIFANVLFVIMADYIRDSYMWVMLSILISSSSSHHSFWKKVFLIVV